MSLKKPRGMIEFLLLQLLEQKDSYGYEVSKEIKELSGGHWDPSPGTIYGALERLNKKDYLKRIKKEKKERKYFKITEKGKKRLKKHKKNIEDIRDNYIKIMLSFLNLFKEFHGEEEFKILLKKIDKEFESADIETK